MNLCDKSLNFSEKFFLSWIKCFFLKKSFLPKKWTMFFILLSSGRIKANYQKIEKLIKISNYPHNKKKILSFFWTGGAAP